MGTPPFDPELSDFEKKGCPRRCLLSRHPLQIVINTSFTLLLVAVRFVSGSCEQEHRGALAGANVYLTNGQMAESNQ